MGPKRRRYLAMAARTRHAYALIDEHVEAGLVPLAARGITRSCTRGCNACCRQFISCSVPEAAAILARHAPVVQEVAPRLREDAALALALAERVGVAVGSAVPGAQIRDRLAGPWWDERRDCAFLDDAGDCRIYSDRPAVCRTYMVASEPALCGSETETSVRVLGVDHEGVIRVLELAHGAPITMGHMPAMLLMLRDEMKG